MSNAYLKRHAFCGQLIHQPPEDSLRMVVVVPAFRERNIKRLLTSLVSCQKPSGTIEILVVINASEQAQADTILLNDSTASDVRSMVRQMPSWIKLHLLEQNRLPAKKAGVGLARKIGMDEAVRRFEQIRCDGVIVCIDADCTCSSTYFQAIERYFQRNPNKWSGCLDFAHSIEGLSPVDGSAIIQYELHLRYFINAQRVIHLPFAYQTIGSCMSVRSLAYQKRGGMNTRQAGEDFYFIHKFSSINRHADIPGALVYPSGRFSDRVPFGTGRAVANFRRTGEQKTYSWQSFAHLAPLIKNLRLIYRNGLSAQLMDGNPLLGDYLDHVNFSNKMATFKQETASYDTFQNRFFQWFDAFRLMKYLHFARAFYPDQDVVSQALLFINLATGVDVKRPGEASELLARFRKLDRALINGGPDES